MVHWSRWVGGVVYSAHRHLKVTVNIFLITVEKQTNERQLNESIRSISLAMSRDPQNQHILPLLSVITGKKRFHHAEIERHLLAPTNSRLIKGKMVLKIEEHLTENSRLKASEKLQTGLAKSDYCTAYSTGLPCDPWGITFSPCWEQKHLVTRHWQKMKHFACGWITRCTLAFVVALIGLAKQWENVPNTLDRLVKWVRPWYLLLSPNKLYTCYSLQRQPIHAKQLK